MRISDWSADVCSSDLTTEIHDRVMPEDAEEAAAIAAAGGPKYPAFWAVIGQITVLDIVFSLDSVITAIGLTDHLAIMIAAVQIGRASCRERWWQYVSNAVVAVS